MRIKQTNQNRITPKNIVKILSLLLLLSGCSSAYSLIDSSIAKTKTEDFINHLDINYYTKKGSDYVNPHYSPLRLGKSINELDRVYDYDFERLILTETQLKNIDRKKVLSEIFSRVTKEAKTNTERHIAVLKFLQQSSFHNPIQPVYPDKKIVSDPLVLLTLGEMRCGHIARVAVDLFESGGYKGRIVQLGGHVIAEIYYDNSWHYFDADAFGGGETIINKDGVIPSVAELSKTPYVIDSLAHRRELTYTGRIRRVSTKYPSWAYFAQKAYKKANPRYVYKTANQKQIENKYYGWNYVKRESALTRNLYEMTPKYQPGAPIIEDIKVNYASDKSSIDIKWQPSLDKDKDLLGYKIFVSHQSRGWHYNQFRGDDSLLKYWDNSQSWQSEMYDKLYQTPPHEVALLTTSQNQISLPVERGNTYYITIMPYDAHGESVGKTLYHSSEELKISVDKN